MPATTPLSQPIPSTTLERVQTLLWQTIAPLGEAGLVITEAFLGQAATPPEADWTLFTLVVSAPFSALLLGKPIEAEFNRSDSSQPSTYQISLTFDAEAIATFINQLATGFPTDSDIYQSLQHARAIPQPNQPEFQSNFTLHLIQALSDRFDLPFDQSVATSLKQQVEQERLLNQVATQIRQSLELPIILQTAVEQARSVLQVDRLVIYQLDVPTSCLLSQAATHLTATESVADLASATSINLVIHEALASKAIPSVLLLGEDLCFFPTSGVRDRYLQVQAVAVEDVLSQYTHQYCLLEFLKKAEVRAKLVVPILVKGDLWGFLIAHECYHPRRWQESEKKFLQQIAEHLAIAIQQAQLYTQVQQQKQTLERRVVERTQALHDALMSAQLANRSKSEFLAAISHELRTPLTCIIGMSATLLRWLDGQLPERQQNFLQTIHNSGQHLLEIFNNILDLSQFEAGRAILNLREISLTVLAQQSLRMFQEKAVQAGVLLELDLQVLPQRDRLVADPRRIRQILINLLSNAIKFTPRNGKVTLRVSADDQAVTFHIKDTGIGISEQQRSLLFQKFQQLDSSYQREYEGTGLGLALTKQLVEMHNGSITVESTEGVGTIFIVRLPRRAIAATKPVNELEPLTSPDYPIGRVFLLASHSDNADIVCDLLTASGCQLIWMTEGYIAVSQIEILQPTLVIIDLQLGDSDSYEIIRQLRHNPATKHLKIIAMTSNHPSEEQRRCLEVKADDYITKPISPKQMLIKLNEWMTNIPLNRSDQPCSDA